MEMEQEAEAQAAKSDDAGTPRSTGPVTGIDDNGSGANKGIDDGTEKSETGDDNGGKGTEVGDDNGGTNGQVTDRGGHGGPGRGQDDVAQPIVVAGTPTVTFSIDT
jgi:hypothetical protein